MAKKFMFICFGVLALAGAYALGATRVDAQFPASDVVQMLHTNNETFTIITVGGDIYTRVGLPTQVGGVPQWTAPNYNWTYMGNCFLGAVTDQNNTLSGVKTLFR